MKTIRVLLADDHAIVRDGIRALLEGSEEIDVVAVTADGLETVRQARELKPDVVVMDIAMPRLNGLGATRRVLRDCSDCRVLIVSQREDPEHVRAAVEAGASGYLLKRDAGADLAEGIRAVDTWGAVLHPMAARCLLDSYHECASAQRVDSNERLTDREREIMILVAEGHTNQQIAEMLHVSPKTVDRHRSNPMSKLDLHDRTEVVKYALRKKLIDL
jgi:DNA-binding NarL/FixJ family response regulator